MSKIDMNDLWSEYDYGKPYKPKDPMAGERLLQKIKEKEAELKKAKTKQIQDEEAKKVRKKYIIYGLIAVAGYFAYKKFKK